MDINAIAWLENWVQGPLRPDLTLLFDSPVETGMARAGKRGVFDRFEVEKLHFFERVRAAYLEQAEQHPERIRLIKADQPLQDVQNALLEVLKKIVGERVEVSSGIEK
jgi:dTMP kinase